MRRIVRIRDREVKLSPREYDILRVLVQHAGKVLTHHFLIRQVWGGVADVQNLRVHVRQLRQKIDDNAEQPTYIRTETVWATACVWPTEKRTKRFEPRRAGPWSSGGRSETRGTFWRHPRA